MELENAQQNQPQSPQKKIIVLAPGQKVTINHNNQFSTFYSDRKGNISQINKINNYNPDKNVNILFILF